VVRDAVDRARAELAPLQLVEAVRVRALIALRQEQLAEAAAGLDEALALTRRLPYPYQEARLLHVNGLVSYRQGEGERARAHLDAALAIFDRLGASRDSAQVRADRRGW
jgi:hypothetical protein